MNEEIKVHVVKYPDRANLVMRYVDPFTGRQVQRSTGTANQKEALGVAAVWQDELRTGRYKAPSRVTWEELPGKPIRNSRVMTPPCASTTPRTMLTRPS